MNLVQQHLHSFSDHGGGHYHEDVTPDIIHHLGYLKPAEFLYVIDKP